MCMCVCMCVCVCVHVCTCMCVCVCVCYEGAYSYANIDGTSLQSCSTRNILDIATVGPTPVAYTTMTSYVYCVMCVIWRTHVRRQFTSNGLKFQSLGSVSSVSVPISI